MCFKAGGVTTRSLPILGRLVDAPVREAFAHEALDMTPWLAANLDRISDAIGVTLEDPDTEVPVEGFAADILAHDPAGDRKVLIENQLEGSDHTHLGQIMTYLAGLDASVMVWIAPSFREPHLAAIRWLNENTVEPFAFFAVRLRAVRIADSLPAPLFEVVERPNGWERQMHQAARKREGLTEVGERRLAFWTHLAERHPGLGTARTAASSVALPLGSGFALVLYLAVREVGLFVRGGRGENSAAARERLAPRMGDLAAALGVPAEGFEPSEALAVDTLDRTNWDEATGWLAERAARWQAAFVQTFGRETE